MKFNRDTFLICIFLAACIMCVVAFHLAFLPGDVRFARAPEAERFNYKIPVNVASAMEFKAFFGLSARKSSAIVKAREAAPFKSAEDLSRVKTLNDNDRARIAPFLAYEEEKR